MTADTPTSVATINHLLLGAPYTSPLVIPGDWLVDELEGRSAMGGSGEAGGRRFSRVGQRCSSIGARAVQLPTRFAPPL